jgi:L-aminopeptidase/D-esterase-like protein
VPERFAPIAGLKIGHAQDERARTGCTVFLAEAGMVAACRVLGGAVGERELETLRRGHVAQRIHALVLAGGSAFGLDAACGVMRWCEARRIGFDTGRTRDPSLESFGVNPSPEALGTSSSTRTIRVPIVPSAILYDFGVGETTTEFGPAARPRHPDAAMGYAAVSAASAAPSDAPVAEGRVGVGTGCTVGKLYGMERACDAGVGCWTEELPGGVRVSAFAAVNAFGDVLDPDTGRILAGTRAAKDSREFIDTAAALRAGAVTPRFGGSPRAPSESGTNTVLVAVATNAALTHPVAERLAELAAPGMARVLSPAHTQFDGDILFALAPAPPDSTLRADVDALGGAAAEAVARAIARSVR